MSQELATDWKVGNNFYKHSNRVIERSLENDRH